MMGGRGRVRVEKNRLEQRVGARWAAARVTPRYNAAPAQSLPVILNTAPHTIQFLRWGLRPAWGTKRTTRAGIINVRAETLRERSTFQRDVAERRCLVLADSFYVWKTKGKQKIPYRVVLTSGEPFAFAGIWEENTDTGGRPVKTFAIITTEANALVGRVQNRMPVILRKETERQWLADDLPPEHVLSLLSPYPAHGMRMYEVSPRVNRTANDAPELITPVREKREVQKRLSLQEQKQVVRYFLRGRQKEARKGQHLLEGFSTL
jgi:putative SOS response-associated peptidase YedK